MSHDTFASVPAFLFRIWFHASLSYSKTNRLYSGRETESVNKIFAYPSDFQAKIGINRKDIREPVENAFQVCMNVLGMSTGDYLIDDMYGFCEFLMFSFPNYLFDFIQIVFLKH